MKRFSWIFLIAAAAACFVLTGCPMDPTELSFVSFKADGAAVTLRSGDIPYLDDEYAHAYGGFFSPKSALHVEASEEDNNDHFLRFYFHGTTVGTYTSEDEEGGVEAEYTTDWSGSGSYQSQQFTVTLSRYDEVGGFMEGTFSGTVGDGVLVTIAITEGRFRVVRVE